MEYTPQIPNHEEQQALVFRSLRELIHSDVFRRSARIIRFLEYVVLESLSATPKLTERTIGIVVFDRADDWDPKLDPIVRIEARRLRDKLGQYYSSVSSEQAVVMSLPKGGYRISFDWRPLPPLEDHDDSEANSEQEGSEGVWNLGDEDFVAAPVRRSFAWNRWQLWVMLILLAACTCLAVVALNISDFRIAEDRGIWVDSFRVGNELNQEMDGTAVAGKIADHIRQLQQDTRTTWTAPPVEDSWTSQRGSSWSSRIEQSLRALVLPQDEGSIPTTDVTGSIESLGANDVSLYIRGGDIEPKAFIGKKSELAAVLQSAAEYIYGACQPSSYSVYLTEHGRSSDAINFVSLNYPKARHLGDRVQLLYSWATALSQEGNHKDAIEKYELNIAMAPQSWGSYVALQDEYEDLGQTERALEIGHELESRAHRGSWWFEHLPPRLFRRPGPDAYMATDQLTNDYIDLKRSIQSELKLQEGGAELLPLYSAYAQVLSALHERSGAQLQLDLAAHQDNDGAAEGSLLYARVVLAIEEQDDSRLRSILTLYRKQIMDDADRHSLALDPDAVCHIMTAYERIGDTAVSDLLDSQSSNSADCLVEKARLQASRGHIGEAYAVFQRAIADFPSLPYPHYEYALLLLKQGDLRDANAQLQIAHVTGPYWAEPLEMLAELAAKSGDLGSSLALYRQGARCAPSWGHLYIAWADALAHIGSSAEAAAKLKAADSMDLTPSEQADLKGVSDSIRTKIQ